MSCSVHSGQITIGCLAFLLFSSFSLSDPTTLGAVDCLKQYKKWYLKWAKVRSQKRLQNIYKGYKLLSWEGINCTVITCKHQSILVTDCRELVRFPVSISTLITRIKFVCCKHESALNESKWSANSGSYTTIETYVKLPQWTRRTCIAVSPSCSSVSRIKQTSHFDQKLIIKYTFCVWYRESSRHWYSTNKTTVNCRF